MFEFIVLYGSVYRSLLGTVMKLDGFVEVQDLIL